MATKILPLTSDPNQNFTCTLPIDSKNLTLRFNFRWNVDGKYWWMAVSNPNTGHSLLDGVPLLTGEYPAANILEQYKYLGIGSAFLIKTGQLDMDNPDDTNLGTDFVLVWSDTY